jgi:hypothetical protein
MPVPWNYRSLLEASHRFNSFHRFVDLITVGLFFVVAFAALNKLMPKRLVDWEFFDMSWKAIGFLFVIFFILLVNQLHQESMRRELSAFQKEAALKAARDKNNIRRR